MALALAKHKGLRKHESSMLTQIRTGKVGLKAFLHQHWVPGILTPQCSCEEADETPQHLFVDCPEMVRAQRASEEEAAGFYPAVRHGFLYGIELVGDLHVP